MRNQLTRRALFWAAVLFALWLLVSESAEPVHLLVGLLAALGVAVINFGARPASGRPVRWAHALLYFPWLCGQIIVSGLRVAYLILHPRLPIRPVLIRHKTGLDDDRAILLLGNSITLTPGTVTVEASREGLIVHAIDGEKGAVASAKKLEHRVAGVFRAQGGRS
ncbi:MAG: Na+/H+ antiporter subunit E [Bryobacterales bacterium]|nr:Na+/H+ antiporter subunit E [Bryobacterales bacterium]